VFGVWVAYWFYYLRAPRCEQRAERSNKLLRVANHVSGNNFLAIGRHDVPRGEKERINSYLRLQMEMHPQYES